MQSSDVHSAVTSVTAGGEDSELVKYSPSVLHSGSGSMASTQGPLARTSDLPLPLFQKAGELWGRSFLFASSRKDTHKEYREEETG